MIRFKKNLPRYTDFFFRWTNFPNYFFVKNVKQFITAQLDQVRRNFLNFAYL